MAWKLRKEKPGESTSKRLVAATKAFLSLHCVFLGLCIFLKAVPFLDMEISFQQTQHGQYAFLVYQSLNKVLC